MKTKGRVEVSSLGAKTDVHPKKCKAHRDDNHHPVCDSIKVPVVLINAQQQTRTHK
jgi:hypothetical protein